MSIDFSLLALMSLGGAIRRRFFYICLLPHVVFGSSRSRAEDQPRTVAPVDTHCYLTDFKPANFPWPPSDCLNVEEVFKNYKYYETELNWPQRKLTVKMIVSGQLQQTDQYKVTKENTLASFSPPQPK